MQVDWTPPAGGDKEMLDLLHQLLQQSCWPKSTSVLRMCPPTHSVVHSQPAYPHPKGRQRVALSVSSTLPPPKEMNKTASKLAVPCDKYRMVEAEATGFEPAVSSLTGMYAWPLHHL